MKLSRRNFIIGSGLAASGVASRAGAQTNLANLPSTMVWSTYDVGSTGYVEASAIADAFGKKYGSRVRLQPAGTAIGRVLPLTEGKASHAWLANECYFAAEGLYEYAAPDWGPQDLRTLMGRQNAFSVVATKVSGITEPKHMKGKKFAIAKANSSVNIKTDPILAFADLTWKDVELVEFPSYAAALKALVEGKADAAGAAPNAAVLRELEASPNGISWVALDPANKEGWAKAKKAVPFVEPFQESIGAGVSADKPIWMMGYRYPMITVYAKAPEAEVYAMTKAVAETYDLYKDANPIMPRWDIKKAGTPPMDAAFHDGAIRYLKEIKVWSADHDAFQAGALKRQKALQAGWAKMMAGPAKSAKPEEVAKMWEEERLKLIAAL
jgi:TRAP transporter TAXI family solute receptor